MRDEQEITDRINRTRAYCARLESDDAERLVLEDQVDLLRWALGEDVPLPD